jgi:cell wall assembly regulator SMI1
MTDSNSKMASIVERLRKVTEKKFPHLPPDILAPGVSLAEIEVFEKEKNLKLPEDVKEYLQCIDGQEIVCQQGVLNGCYLMSLDHINTNMKGWSKTMGDNYLGWEPYSLSLPPEFIQGVYCNPKSWVGLVTDLCGNFVAVDLAPGPRGKIGQVTIYGRDFPDYRCVVADSWTEFLDGCVSYMENGPDDNFYMDVIYCKKVKELKEKYNLDC